MNAWPDELWANERSRMWATLDRYVKDVDAEIDLFPCTTESIVPWAALGMSVILLLSAGMAPVAAMVGWRGIRNKLRQRGIG